MVVHVSDFHPLEQNFHSEAVENNSDRAQTVSDYSKLVEQVAPTLHTELVVAAAAILFERLLRR